MPGTASVERRLRVPEQQLERQIAPRHQPRALEAEDAVGVVRAAEQRGVDAARRIRAQRSRGERRTATDEGAFRAWHVMPDALTGRKIWTNTMPASDAPACASHWQLAPAGRPAAESARRRGIALLTSAVPFAPVTVGVDVDASSRVVARPRSRSRRRRRHELGGVHGGDAACVEPSPVPLARKTSA